VLSTNDPSDLAVNVPLTWRDPATGADVQPIPSIVRSNPPPTVRHDEVTAHVPTTLPPQGVTFLQPELPPESPVEAPPVAPTVEVLPPVAPFSSTPASLSLAICTRGSQAPKAGKDKRMSVKRDWRLWYMLC